jgi:hypothetical protein
MVNPHQIGCGNVQEDHRMPMLIICMFPIHSCLFVMQAVTVGMTFTSLDTVII